MPILGSGPSGLQNSGFNVKLQHFEAKTQHLEARIQHFEVKIQHFDPETQPFDAKIQHIEAKIQHFDAQIQDLLTKMQHLDAKIQDFEARMLKCKSGAYIFKNKGRPQKGPFFMKKTPGLSSLGPILGGGPSGLQNPGF